MPLHKLEYTTVCNEKKILGKLTRNVWLNLKNLDPVDTNTLTQKFGALSKSPGSASLKCANPDNDKDKGLNNIKGAFAYLDATKKYEMPDFNKVVEDMIMAKRDLFTNDQAKEVNKSTDQMWLDFMKRIKEPQIQELLKSMGQYQLVDDAYGWKISYKNILRVMAQKPDATFVQTRSQWLKKYDRRVRFNATPIGIQVPVKNSDPTPQEMLDYAASLGYDKNIDINSLSQQQRDRILNGARQRNATFFHMVAMYDVSDTELVNPNGPDKWTDEVGFENNMTMKLNQAAIHDKAKNLKITSDEANKIYNSETGNLKILCQAIRNGILTQFPSVKTYKPTDENNEDQLYQCFMKMVAWLADYLIEMGEKLAKAENRQEMCKIATTVVLCLVRLAPKDVAQKISSNQLTEKSYFDVRNIVNTIIKLINNNSPKNESININEMNYPLLNSVEELYDMLGINPQDVKQDNEGIDSVKESFNNMMNRIKSADKLREEWREN